MRADNAGEGEFLTLCRLPGVARRTTSMLVYHGTDGRRFSMAKKWSYAGDFR